MNRIALSTFFVILTAFLMAQEYVDSDSGIVHSEGRFGESLQLRGYEIRAVESPMIVEKEGALTAQITKNGAPVQGMDVQGQILGSAKKEIFFAQTQETAPGVYTFTWTPGFAGDYWAQFVFRSDQDIVLQPSFPVHVTDPRSAYWLFGSIGLGIIALIAGFYGAREKKRFNYKTMGIATVIAIVLIGLGYSVSTFYASGGESGFVVCGSDGCDLAIHWHSNIKMNICGEEFDLPLEAGDLDKVHTHKEKNRFHFHSLIKTDTQGGELLEPQKLSVGQLFDHVGIRFDANCFGERCTGDPCPDGTPGTLRMTLNGAPHTDLASYSWKDGDKMEVVFG